MSEVVPLYDGHKPHVARIGEELDALITRRIEIGNITAEELIGALEMAKLNIFWSLAVDEDE